MDSWSATEGLNAIAEGPTNAEAFFCLGEKYNKWKIFRADLPALLSKALDEKLPALLNKALDEKLPAILNNALDEKLLALVNKALEDLSAILSKALNEKLAALLNKALEKKLPAHPMHNKGNFEPDNRAKVFEKVEESLSK